MIENNSKIKDECICGLKKLVDDFDLDTAKELAMAFLEDSQPAIPKIEAAIQSEDAEGVRIQAHLLKGCSRIINAMTFETVASELELSAKNGDWKSINEHFTNLKPTYLEIKDSIEEFAK